jgi:hypothetical protein
LNSGRTGCQVAPGMFTIVNMPGATWRPVRPLFKPD